MVKKLVLSLTCLAPLMLAPVAAVARTTPQPAAKVTPSKVQPSSAAKPGAARSKAQPGAVQPKSAHSKERIYTVKPGVLEEMERKRAGIRPRQRTEVAGQSELPFVGFSPTGNSIAGIGMWRMYSADRLDPNRSRPLRGTKGTTGRAAAVGFQLNF